MAVAHETLTREELHDELDRLSRATLDLSAEQFLQHYRDRRLDMAAPAVSRLALLARVLLATNHRPKS